MTIGQSSVSWNERILQDIERFSKTNLPLQDRSSLNELKLAMLLALHSDSPAETMLQLQDIALALLRLDWSSGELCKFYGCVLSSVIQASHVLLPQCRDYEGDNPVLLSIVAIHWEPYSIAAVCNALVDAYECLNHDTIQFLQVSFFIARYFINMQTGTDIYCHTYQYPSRGIKGTSSLL